MLSICLFLVYTLFLSYFTGRLIAFFLNKDSKSFCWMAIGFFAYLGIMQVIVSIAIPLGISSKIVFVLYYLIAFALIALCFIKKVDLKPTKIDIITLVVGVLISIVSIYRACGYTLGENLFDSVFYLSQVNESSTTATLGGMWYYSGAAQEIDAIHDFQAFYYYFSMGIKLFRNLKLMDEIMIIPFYYWTSAVIFYLMLGSTIVNLFIKFFTKAKWVGALWIVMVSYYFYKYFNISLAFIGNNWRIVCLSYILYFIYGFIQEKEVKPLYLCAILFSGLCAVSSSGLFIGVFMIASLMVYCIYFYQDDNAYQACLLCLLAIYPFLFFTIAGMFSLIMACLVTVLLLGYYALFMYMVKKAKVSTFYKVHQYLVPVVIVVMIVMSFFLQGSTYPYSHFFENHSIMDMCNDYFGFDTIPVLITNIVLWLTILVYIIFEPHQEMKKYLGINIVLFVNPLVMPFVARFLADIVYFREFDILMNMFTFALFCSGLSYLKWKKIVPTACAAGIALCGYSSVTQFSTTFSNEFTPKEGYNPFMRVTDDEIDLYKAFEDELADVQTRSKVISQVASTKGYIENIELVYDVDATRPATRYEEVKIAAPSNLINCLILRDYAEQIVYSSNPNFETLNDDIMAEDPDYLILRKDQYKIQDGEYVPIYLDIRGIADVIYENDTFVLMKVKY